jgi:hypothetical protein
MILLCGIPSEAPLRLAIEAAERSGADYLVFNQRLAGQSALQVATRFQDGRPLLEGTLRLGEQVFPLEAFSGAYLRLMDFQELPEYRQGGNPAKIEQLHRALVAWLEAAPLRVMNRAGPMGSNQSKPYQAQLIAQAGFLTPPTLITNDPEAVRAFLAEHGRVIYKSISALRSVVQELTPAGLRALERIRYLPVQFQAFIPGEDLRVHVAGERVFASRIRSTAIDYRYAGREGLDVELESVYLENELAARCRSLSERLELPLCGIDLRLAPGGQVYCFEVNPSPAYSYYQEQTGQDIASAIVAYLR